MRSWLPGKGVLHGYPSEIKFDRLWDRPTVIAKRVKVVLCTQVLHHGAIGQPSPTLEGGPWHVERPRVRDCHERLQLVATLNQLESLDHMKLVGVRCAVIIDKGLVVEADCLNHEFVALVAADRLAIPR